MLVLSSSCFPWLGLVEVHKEPASVPIPLFQDLCLIRDRVLQIYLKMVVVSISVRTVAFRFVEVDKARSKAFTTWFWQGTEDPFRP